MGEQTERWKLEADLIAETLAEHDGVFRVWWQGHSIADCLGFVEMTAEQIANLPTKKASEPTGNTIYNCVVSLPRDDAMDSHLSLAALRWRTDRFGK